MMKKLSEEFGKWVLQINYDKSKYMFIGNTPEDLEINNNISIKQTNKYKYLGATLIDTGSNETDIIN